MKNFALSAFIGISILFCACNTEPTKTVVVEPSITFDGDVTKSDLGDGTFLYSIKKGETLKEEGIIAAGNKNGLWTTYHLKGMVESVKSYKDGVLNGPSLTINNYGNVVERAFYKNGNLNGKRIKYNRQNVKQEENYENGILNGKRSLFYDNGKIQEAGNFVNGKREGNQKWYNEEEKVTIEYEYKNGKRVE